MKELNELRLPVPWGHITAKAWGSPTDFPVLCVHGILDNAGAFDRLIAQLPNHYYYVSIDLPGHGLSSHFPRGIPLDFLNYVLALRYVLEELKWKNFYFVGHSLGGQLGTFYSIIYPDRVKKMILIEGVAPRIVPNENLVSQIRRVHDEVLQVQSERKQRFYTLDEIVYSLRCSRSVCLNSDAADALFKRSVTKVGGMFKYNRDFRLKFYLIPLFNIEQMASILGKLDVKILFIFTRSTLEHLSSDYRQLITNLVGNTKNSDTIYIDGNHDVHNNHPERISPDISKFLDDKTHILSKL